ncbi:MAG TPA: ABC transporter substrate-binding protein, partial [Xanthobacteraceae bacterium]|nr:ABC transporter substrate-binding protein [Xanthobacteraceae bacterium]
AAPLLRIEVNPVAVRNASEIERAIEVFAREPDSAMMVAGSSLAAAHRDLIITLAARHRMPVAYSDSAFTRSGGLFSYAIDRPDNFRQAASYVDRILRGEKPGDLPVQTPTKYELVINLKTARALGLTVPLSLRGRADEVIE